MTSLQAVKIYRDVEVKLLCVLNNFGVGSVVNFTTSYLCFWVTHYRLEGPRIILDVASKTEIHIPSGNQIPVV